MTPPLVVIGAGLAGAEAAWQLARRGLDVELWEMRPGRMTPAHQSDQCGELVCSNSLRSDDPLTSAMGILHREMRGLESLILTMADRHRVPAGSALAVDREGFARAITEALSQHPRIRIRREEVTALPATGWCVVATGPLTSDALSQELVTRLGSERLAFFDAIAPIVSLDSIDFSKAWKQSRYDKGEGDDYINCALDREGYEAFVDALLAGAKIEFKAFEKTPYFEGCMPIEEMARRGRETLRFGPMKPVGLTNPHQPGRRPHAVVQLRQDNRLGTLWNMVGFQTKLTWPEQGRIFRTIPGLEGAEFHRYGSLHRNTFIDSPRLLDGWLRWREDPRVMFAGQITGVEGYGESAAMGLLAGMFLAALVRGRTPPAPPPETALGALLHHVTGGALGTFQPMNVNFGLLPPLAESVPRKERKRLLGERADALFRSWRQNLDFDGV